MPARKSEKTDVTTEDGEVLGTVEPIDYPTEVEPQESAIEFDIEPQPASSDVYAAFVAAQAEIGNVTKNAKNAFFKNAQGQASKFVDLAALNAAVLPVITKHGLGFQQRIDQIGNRFYVVSQAFSGSGAMLPASWYPIITKDENDPQKFGAGVTYARRYAMMAYFSVAAEDDDGNTAAKPPQKTAKTELKEALTSMKADGAKFKELAKRANVDAEKFADLSEDDAKKVLDVANTNVPF